MSTIIIQNETKNLLKQIGKKSQTYDEIIRDLIKIKENPDKRILYGNKIRPTSNQENTTVNGRNDLQ